MQTPPINQYQGDRQSQNYPGGTPSQSPMGSQFGARGSFEAASRASSSTAFRANSSLNIGRPSRGSSLPPLPAMFSVVQPVSPPKGWQTYQQQGIQGAESMERNTYSGRHIFDAAQPNTQSTAARNSTARSFQGAGPSNQPWIDSRGHNYQAYPDDDPNMRSGEPAKTYQGVTASFPHRVSSTFREWTPTRPSQGSYSNIVAPTMNVTPRGTMTNVPYEASPPTSGVQDRQLRLSQAPRRKLE